MAEGTHSRAYASHLLLDLAGIMPQLCVTAAFGAVSIGDIQNGNAFMLTFFGEGKRALPNENIVQTE